MTLDELVTQPWSWVGPVQAEEGGVSYWELRIKELPDFFVAGKTQAEVKGEAVNALRAFLQSYLDHGEQPPLPNPAEGWRFYVSSHAFRPAFTGLTALFHNVPREITKK